MPDVTESELDEELRTEPDGEATPDEQNAPEAETRAPKEGMETCPTCDGGGTINEGNKECPECGGAGEVEAAGQKQNSAAPGLERRKRVRESIEGTVERRAFT